MVVSLRNSINHVIVDLHTSKLNEHMVGILRRSLIDLINHNQTNITINMSLVDSIDTNILGCLISAQKKCKNQGGQVSIYGLKPDILTVFYIIKLDEYINLYNNEFDALNNQNALIRRRLKLIKG